MAESRFSRSDGFSLVEVMTATTIMAVALVSLAHLFALSTTANRSARMSTVTALLAQQKLEQLRGLTWGFDTLGLPVSDISTNLVGGLAAPGCPAMGLTGAGAGLAPSPAGTLISNTDGYVDYLDENGCVLGGGPMPPAGTVFYRRWSVEPLPTNPNNTLVLQVMVTRRADRGAADAGSVARAPEEARLMSIKTRKMQ